MQGDYYVVFVILFLLCAMVHTFNPTVRVNSCTNNKVTFTLSNAANGGIVYVKGAGPGCRHETHNGSYILELTFLSCNIIWGRSFKIAVQRKALYQTEEDKIIPVTCKTDLSDITVHTSIDAMSIEDEPEQTVTIKPTAFMTLYSGGNDVSGKTVKLTDTITLKIELHHQHKGSFDIKATTCKASSIPLISGGCATDTDLFRKFSKPSRGVLMSSFKAFIPTGQTNDRMAITFTCTLDVCVGECTATICPNITGSYGRRRRDEEHTNISYLHVNSSVMISSDGDHNTKDKNDNMICIPWAIFALCIALWICSILVTIYFAITTHRLRTQYYQRPCQYLPDLDSYEAMSAEFDTLSTECDIMSRTSHRMSTTSDRMSTESNMMTSGSDMMSTVSLESQLFLPQYPVKFV